MTAVMISTSIRLLRFLSILRVYIIPLQELTYDFYRVTFHSLNQQGLYFFVRANFDKTI